jgi:RNA polymerase sigma-70 factor (ECF subfamily)
MPVPRTLDQDVATEQFVRLLTDGQCEILRYILALVPDVDAAHEILQDTAVALWRKFDSYDPSRPFVPWGCRFAFQQVLKHRHRQAKRRKCLSIEALHLISAERVEQREFFEERRRALAKCLERLSDADRLLVEERYLRSSATVARLAEATGQKVCTLYKALERVRRRLFECVNRRLKTEGLL